MSSKEENTFADVVRLRVWYFRIRTTRSLRSVVEEDVGFGPENIGVPTEEIWKRVEESLGCGRDDCSYRHHSPNKLSGGQKQRVAIAGVMAMKPKCIVLDEPTAMLDPNGRKEVIRTAHELNRKEGVTIILITHYMEEVVDADQVIVMDDGQSRHGGNAAGSVFPGGRTQGVPAGCAAGDDFSRSSCSQSGIDATRSVCCTARNLWTRFLRVAQIGE